MEIENTNPLVSVCIPLYNHEKYVQETIQSVIDQDYQNIELIIIDDGSTDASGVIVQEMIQLCQSRFVRFEFIQRENKGLSSTLNEAIDWSRGQYFSPIASDDMMLRGKTSSLVGYLEVNPECGAVFGQINSINSAGVKKKAPYFELGTFDFNWLLCNLGGPPAPAQLVRMDAIIEVGKYRPGIIVEDLYMWLAISALGYEITIIDSVVVNYRDHQENITKNFEKMLAGRMQVIGFYMNSTHFSLACSQVYLMAAHESFLSSKRRSLTFFCAAVKKKPEILFRQSAVVYVFRMIAPKFIYQKITLSVKYLSNYFK